MVQRRAVLSSLGIVVGFAGHLVGAPLHAAQGGALSIDPNTGDYRITYRQPYPPYDLTSITFIPATKIDPTIKGRQSIDNRWFVDYSYRIANGRGAKQPLIQFLFPATSVESGSQQSPHLWSGLATPNRETGGYTVDWGYDDFSEGGPNGLPPGQSQNGFAIRSADLAGVGVARLRGFRVSSDYPDDGPDPGTEIGQRLGHLVANDFVTRNVAIPRVPVPTPYDAAVVLNNIQTHLDTDLAGMRLVEPALVTELDRWLSAAVSAARSGNDKALRADVREARKLLKYEHTDLDKDDDWSGDDGKEKKPKPRIDKLAARVLDFDLRYVEERARGRDD